MPAQTKKTWLMQRFTCHQLVPWDVLVGKFASLAVYVGIFDLLLLVALGREYFPLLLS